MGRLCSGLLFPVSCLILAQVTGSGACPGSADVRGFGSFWKVDLRTDWDC
uniref:Interleukin 4 receptor n=1 Tax=Propithecus coquereli TaxID=379532 RepID=A0A2K6GZY6_PROCO